MYDLTKTLEYIASLETPPPPLEIDGVLAESLAGPAGSRIQPDIGPTAAALCDVLVRTTGARSILEIGTSIGYSACVLGRAAREIGGRVTTIEIDDRLASIARRNIGAAGLSPWVEVVTADSREAVAATPGPFDLILQDGSKDDYLPLLGPLTGRLRAGGLLVSDDVLFPVMEIPESARGWQRAIASYNEALKASRVLRTVWLPIGDGIAVSVRAGDPAGSAHPLPGRSGGSGRA